MIRSILKQKQMPHYLWGEAAATAAYLSIEAPQRSCKTKHQIIGLVIQFS